MPTKLAQIERESLIARAEEKESTIVEKICRITLSEDWPRPLDLRWCEGLGKKTSILMLKPGKSIEVPLGRAHSWFGPFDLFRVYDEELRKVPTDEKLVATLRDHIATESARYLKTYDYPRGNGRGYHPNMEPVGPHRSPDVTIQVLSPDGQHDAPFRLYEEYGIGEFDAEYPLDSFRPRETEAQIHERYESMLKEREAEAQRRDRELAELRGQLKGFMARTIVKEKVEA